MIFCDLCFLFCNGFSQTSADFLIFIILNLIIKLLIVLQTKIINISHPDIIQFSLKLPPLSIKMYNKTPFFIEKLLGYFCICRSIFLTAVLSYLFVFSTKDHSATFWIIPFQIYLMLSFYASVKIINGLDCVSCDEFGDCESLKILSFLGEVR